MTFGEHIACNGYRDRRCTILINDNSARELLARDIGSGDTGDAPLEGFTRLGRIGLDQEFSIPPSLTEDSTAERS